MNDFQDKKEELKRNIAIICTLIVAVFIAYMFLIGFDKIADNRAKNPNNLIRGCMHYYGSGKHKHASLGEYINLRVDGIYATSLSAFSVEFKRQVDIETLHKDMKKSGSDKCYPVDYIMLDFMIVKRVFIYKYYDDKIIHTNILKFQ